MEEYKQRFEEKYGKPLDISPEIYDILERSDIILDSDEHKKYCINYVIKNHRVEEYDKVNQEMKQNKNDIDSMKKQKDIDYDIYVSKLKLYSELLQKKTEILEERIDLKNEEHKYPYYQTCVDCGGIGILVTEDDNEFTMIICNCDLGRCYYEK